MNDGPQRANTLYGKIIRRRTEIVGDLVLGEQSSQ